MGKHALITGITGQDGSYLAELLLSKDYDVYGVIRRSSVTKLDRLEGIEDRIHLLSGDLIDERSLTHVLDVAEPDEVYNLAAQSFVPESWTQPILTGEVTALGVTRVLDAIRTVNPHNLFTAESRVFPGMMGALTASLRPEPAMGRGTLLRAATCNIDRSCSISLRIWRNALSKGSTSFTIAVWWRPSSNRWARSGRHRWRFRPGLLG